MFVLVDGCCLLWCWILVHCSLVLLLFVAVAVGVVDKTGVVGAVCSLHYCALESLFSLLLCHGCIRPAMPPIIPSTPAESTFAASSGNHS